MIGRAKWARSAFYPDMIDEPLHEILQKRYAKTIKMNHTELPGYITPEVALAARLTQSELIFLIFGLTLAGTEFRWGHGSVASVIWFFRYLSDNFPEEIEPAADLKQRLLDKMAGKLRPPWSRFRLRLIDHSA